MKVNNEFLDYYVSFLFEGCNLKTISSIFEVKDNVVINNSVKVDVLRKKVVLVNGSFSEDCFRMAIYDKNEDEEYYIKANTNNGITFISGLKDSFCVTKLFSREVLSSDIYSSGEDVLKIDNKRLNFSNKTI